MSKTPKTPKTPKTIEETYRKLSQREHILLRPDTYIGTIKKQAEECWILNEETQKMKKQFLEYSPGFIKIFDEILTNATDHACRDSTVKSIKIDINKESGVISVWNDGEGIPVQLHSEHDCYVPELIFGHLLTGSNYDDSENRTGAGRNGYGGKLTNIYSKTFTVETSDSKKKFIQKFTENMSEKSKPKVTSSSNSKSYTKITFLPDYPRFNMSGLEDDTMKILTKRVIDCIAYTDPKVGIYLNGTKLKGKNFTDYIKYYFDETETPKIISERFVVNGLLWEYAVVPQTAQGSQNEYTQVSFVNGNATLQGGKHVDYIMYQITNKLKDLIESKKKSLAGKVKTSYIKDRLFFFLNATVHNPTFNSQTKELLTTQSKDFGCKIEVSDSFLMKLYRSPLVTDIIDTIAAKESIALRKTTDGKKISKVIVNKLEDAVLAGTSRSKECTLIVTEGLSALTFALWGRNKVGTERYGCFPLKGKGLSVRDASVSQLKNNEELCNIKKILGLKDGVKYTSVDDLRYGKVIVLVDSDVDGSHIKGLFANFIHYFWPELLGMDFLQTIRTPIVKAIRGKEVIEFFTEQDYHKWQKNVSNVSKYQIRYFKGLGTSTKTDAQDTFQRLDKLQITYFRKDAECDSAILLAFDKDSKGECANARKEWLSNYDNSVYIDAKETRVSYNNLIHKELVHFSIYDNMRSIPSICDGLKPSQRKIVYYMLKKNVESSVKVAQLSGYISAETSYHHGEVSLQQAIILMAQNFTGTNNVNLLYPDGNFGSRYNLKDSASPRYIYTRLAETAKNIFDPRDTPLLKLLEDDGHVVEPEWFLPIIPMVLVNGCEGIGTGYSTSIPPYNPIEIIDNLMILNSGNEKSLKKLLPYFKGFQGTVVELDPTHFQTVGKWKKHSSKTIQVTEIPIGSGVTLYKEYIESLIEKGVHGIVDIQNKTLDENSAIEFIIEFKNSQVLNDLIESGTVEKTLKLTKNLSTTNMYLFNKNRQIKKYTSPEEILKEFYTLRIEYYQKRKEYTLKNLKEKLLVLKAKILFINGIIDNTININKKTKMQSIDILEKMKMYKCENSFDYLLNMPIYSFTLERITALEKEFSKVQAEISELEKLSQHNLYDIDLKVLRKQLAV